MSMTEDDFREFVRARQHSLLKLAYLLAGDWHSAQDLLQGALLKSYRRRRSLDGGSVEAYVRAALVNGQRDTWRRRLPTPTETLPETTEDDLADSVSVRHSLLQALQTLPQQQRAVLVLRYYEDLSEAQIAAALGCSAGTVKSHAHRALQRLHVTASSLNPDEMETRT